MLLRMMGLAEIRQSAPASQDAKAKISYLGVKTPSPTMGLLLL
jgi:hypothetical protein